MLRGQTQWLGVCQRGTERNLLLRPFPKLETCFCSASSDRVCTCAVSCAIFFTVLSLTIWPLCIFHLCLWCMLEQMFPFPVANNSLSSVLCLLSQIVLLLFYYSYRTFKMKSIQYLSMKVWKKLNYPAKNVLLYLVIKAKLHLGNYHMEHRFFIQLFLLPAPNLVYPLTLCQPCSSCPFPDRSLYVTGYILC